VTFAALVSRYGWVALLAAGAILFYAASGLPVMGDAESPASGHVSPRYIEKAYEETGAPNMVTAVLADYRSYDTLGETVVIFTAGLACLLILGAFSSSDSESNTDQESPMTYSFGSDVLDAASRILFPFIALFALYVVFHGHTSPGGGFQGGAILAAALMLTRLIRGRSHTRWLDLGKALRLASIGILVYAGIGVTSLFYSRNFLDYSALPLPFHGGHLREFGSLGVEIGVFISVSAVLIMIFEALTEG
jgi:multicomponent Na+:H+ antiporter subunit B